MKKKVYNKLVRDGIPAHLESQGLQYESTILDNEADYERAVRRKILEEAAELAGTKTREDLVKELADVREILTTLQRQQGISEDEVEKARQDKLTKKGGFAKRIYISWAEEKETG